MLCFQCCGRVLSFVSLHCTGVRIFVFLCNAGYRARDPGKISRKQHCAGSGAFGTEPWPVPDEPCLFLSGAAGLFSPTTFPEWRKTKDSGIYLQKPGKCCIRRSAVSADLKDYTVGDGNGDGRLPGWCRYFSVWNSEKSSFQRCKVL